MSDPSFDPETLLDQASSTAELSDFGPDDFREPLRVLCETLNRAPLSEKGRKRNQRRPPNRSPDLPPPLNRPRR